MDPLPDFWLPIILAVLGIGGTVVVTVTQLRARRAELDDERAARDAAERERRRESVIEAVYDAAGPLISAALIPTELRNAVPDRVTRTTAKVVRVIRLSGSPDRADLHEWFASRARDWASVAAPDDIIALEVSMLAEIDAWFDGSATAAEIRSRAASSI